MLPPVRPYLGLRICAEEPLKHLQGIQDPVVSALAVGQQAAHISRGHKLLRDLVGVADWQAGIGQQVARAEVIGELAWAGRVRVGQLALRHHESIPQRAQLDNDEGWAAGMGRPAEGTTSASVTTLRAVSSSLPLPPTSLQLSPRLSRIEKSGEAQEYTSWMNLLSLCVFSSLAMLIGK